MTDVAYLYRELIHRHFYRYGGTQQLSDSLDQQPHAVYKAINSVDALERLQPYIGISVTCRANSGSPALPMSPVSLQERINTSTT